MKHDIRADIADVKTYLRQTSANNVENETMARIEQLNQGHIQLKTYLEAALTDMKQQLLQRLNATDGKLRFTFDLESKHETDDFHRLHTIWLCRTMLTCNLTGRVMK